MTTAADIRERPHALYRFYDSDDVLLYVGITCNLGTRFSAHSDEKPWWGEVSRIAVQHLANAEDAAIAERAAIRAEHPRWNVQHNVRVADYAGLDALVAAADRRREIRAELKAVNDAIEAEIPKAIKAGLIQAEIARRTGMTRESIAQLCLPPDRRWGRSKRGSDKS